MPPTKLTEMPASIQPERFGRLKKSDVGLAKDILGWKPVEDGDSFVLRQLGRPRDSNTLLLFFSNCTREVATKWTEKLVASVNYCGTRGTSTLEHLQLNSSQALEGLIGDLLIRWYTTGLSSTRKDPNLQLTAVVRKMTPRDTSTKNEPITVSVEDESVAVVYFAKTNSVGNAFSQLKLARSDPEKKLVLRHLHSYEDDTRSYFLGWYNSRQAARSLPLVPGGHVNDTDDFLGLTPTEFKKLCQNPLASWTDHLNAIENTAYVSKERKKFLASNEAYGFHVTVRPIEVSDYEAEDEESSPPPAPAGIDDGLTCAVIMSRSEIL